MARKLLLGLGGLTGALLSAASPAWAETHVIASIRPVQALVLAVTEGVSEPEALIDPGLSPHTFQLKPSQVELLSKADIVFWMGPELETSLEGPLAALAGGARVVALLDAPGLDVLHYKDADGPHDGHDHGPRDPHAWLSPKTSETLVDAIAQELSAIDPANADVYAKNATRAKNRFKLLARQMDGALADSRAVPYLVQHDGFGYIARDFGMTEVGHLQILPGREAGAKHLAAIRDKIKAEGVVCVFTEPQFTPAQAKRLQEETGVRLGVLDPLGTDLEVSPTLSVRIIQSVVLAMNRCLAPKPPAPNPIDTPAAQ